MFHDFCQSVTLVFCQRTHVSHDHHPRGPCCSRARISYDEPCMGAISYQKIFASALSSTFSCASFPSFLAFKEGMWDPQISHSIAFSGRPMGLRCGEQRTP